MENIARKYLRNTIIGYLKRDIAINSIIEEIKRRSDNMIKVIERNENDLNIFSNLFLGLLNPESNEVEKRIKYMFYFIKYSNIEIDNLKFILKLRNKEEFKKMSNKSLYGLSNLKYKLSKEKSI